MLRVQDITTFDTLRLPLRHAVHSDVPGRLTRRKDRDVAQGNPDNCGGLILARLVLQGGQA